MYLKKRALNVLINWLCYLWTGWVMLTVFPIFYSKSMLMLNAKHANANSVRKWKNTFPTLLTSSLNPVRLFSGGISEITLPLFHSISPPLHTHLAIACHSPPPQSHRALQVSVSLFVTGKSKSPFSTDAHPGLTERALNLDGAIFGKGKRRGHWDVSESVLSCAWSLSWYPAWQFGCLNKTTPLTASSHSSSVVSLHHLPPALPLLGFPTVPMYRPAPRCDRSSWFKWTGRSVDCY